MNNKQGHHDDERARATDVLIEAMKTMEALNISPNTAFECVVTHLTNWMLDEQQHHCGTTILLDAALYMQHKAIEKRIIDEITPRSTTTH
jgi:hypothetical protein